MKAFLRILSYANRSMLLYFGYFAFALLSVIFSVINFAALIPILEVIFDQINYDQSSMTGQSGLKTYFYDQLYRVVESSGKKEALLFISILILGSVFLANLFRYVADLIMVELRASVIHNLRRHLFKVIINRPLSYFKSTRKSDLVARLTTDIQEIETSIIFTLKVILKEPFLIIAYCVVLFSISPRLAIYSLILIPISGIIIASIAKVLKRKAIMSQKILGEIGFVSDESITGIKEIKSFKAQSFIRNQFDNVVNDYAAFSRSMGKRFQLAGPLSEFLGVSTMVIILVIGGGMVIDSPGTLSASEFIGFLIIFSQLLPPAKAMSQAHSLAQRGIASADRVFDVIDETKDSRATRIGVPISGFKKTIRFDMVSFKYDRNEVLHDINLTIESGKSYALIGPSGSGKTTLVDLISKFFPPTAGAIYFDDVDLNQIDTSDLRELVSVVSQDVLLFNDSIYQNLTLGKKFERSEVLDACKSAGAHDFIMGIEGNYEATVGDRGSLLSGGQRQRIAIARALLKDSPVLILDEATSAVDLHLEHQIKSSIQELMGGRTSIVITHRISTLESTDFIIVLEQGRITHLGNHHDLMIASDYYRKTVEKIQLAGS